MEKLLTIGVIGKSLWEKNKIISKSIDICNGVMQNPKILSFQNRKKEYPHEFC